MVNNKGFIRTLEAVIAIILILVFIFYITPKVPSVVGKVPENVKIAQTFILDKILVDRDLRNCIINMDIFIGTSSVNECKYAPCWESTDEKEGIKTLIEGNKPFGYEYHCEICSDSTQCTTLPELKKSVYTNTIFVYRDQANYRVLRLYYWRSG